MFEKTDLLTPIKKARTFLKNHAWGQGEYFEQGRYCAIGVVRHVTRNIRLTNEIADYLKNCTPNHVDVIGYNDTPGRKKKDILEMFDCAIKKLENANS